jgi:hypothetical protein
MFVGAKNISKYNCKGKEKFIFYIQQNFPQIRAAFDISKK